MKKTIIEIMKAFLKYGYGFQSFLNMEYPITKNYTIKQLKNFWKQAKNIMSKY